MNTILYAIVIFLDIFYFIVFLDVILGWVRIFGLNLNPTFLRDLLDPIYDFISKYIPTTIGPIQFNALILMLLIFLLKTFVISLNPFISGISTYF